MCQHSYCRHAVRQCSPMGGNIYSVGKAAHYHSIGYSFRHITNEGVAKVYAIGSGMACAHHAYHLVGIEATHITLVIN